MECQHGTRHAPPPPRPTAPYFHAEARVPCDVQQIAMTEMPIRQFRKSTEPSRLALLQGTERLGTAWHGTAWHGTAERYGSLRQDFTNTISIQHQKKNSGPVSSRPTPGRGHSGP